MIVIPKLFKEATGLNAHDVFLYPPALPKKRLLKSETNLPANIVDVVYSLSLEFGEMRYIEVQNDTDDELHDDGAIWILFDEKANGVFGEDFSDSNLSPDVLESMRDFVRSSFRDENSLLHKLMKERKAEWEENAKAYKEKRIASGFSRISQARKTMTSLPITIKADMV